MKNLGLDVTELSPDEDYPDSTFVEDTAILIQNCAIITQPGTESRIGEIDAVEKLLKGEFSEIEKIVGSGTLDGGDVLEAGDYFYIGISERTNKAGADQLIDILSKYVKNYFNEKSKV